jgi:hypothetical protein
MIREEDYKCFSPHLTRSLVTGEIITKLCKDERSAYGFCGKDAMFFKEKEVRPYFTPTHNSKET